ncbi:MAG: HAD-IC family P-type ATPase, partial [Myxococcota bacterium]
MNRFPEVVEAAGALGCDPDKGLRTAQIEAHRAQFGPNRLPAPTPKSVWAMFLGALNDKTLMILIGAAVLALGVEILQGALDANYTPHYIDGLAILGAVLIASLVTTLNEARAAKQFEMLSQVRDDVSVNALRDGHVIRVSIHDLVVADIVNIGTGDRVPADGRLLYGVDLHVDQSTLTGESEPVLKGSNDLVLKGGTTVTGGTGTMLIEAVGVKTEIGQLQATLTQEEEDPTPLQERLAKLADQIGLFGLGAAILTFAALSISAAVTGALPLALDFATIRLLLQFSIVAVTIVVVAVPEGLPLAVTISLAYSVRSMARDNNLVRKLASCETMGAATVICSDKTGTLTKNRMTVVSGRIDGVDFDGPPQTDRLSPDAADRMASVAAINSTAFLESGVDGLVQYLGNPTEAALLSLIVGWGRNWRQLRSDAETTRQLGFSSDRKRMSTLVKASEGRTLLVKGAPEVIVE